MKNLKVFTDGGSRGNPGPAGIGGVVFEVNQEQRDISVEDIKKQKEIYEFSKFIGVATNNESEYLALIEVLKWLVKQKDKEIIIDFYLDSKLVVEQINRTWKIKDKRMKNFAQTVWELLEKLTIKNIQTSFIHVVRELNKEADALVNQALDANKTF